MIEFIVPGKCQAKQRPRYSPRAKRFYTPKETKGYEAEVKWAAKIAVKAQKPFTHAVSIKIDIIEPIPRSASQAFVKQALAGEIYPKNSDIDNKIKSLLDGMNGIIYGDDRQVKKIEACKRYGLEPMAIIRIEEA